MLAGLSEWTTSGRCPITTGKQPALRFRVHGHVQAPHQRYDQRLLLPHVKPGGGQPPDDHALNIARSSNYGEAPGELPVAAMSAPSQHPSIRASVRAAARTRIEWFDPSRPPQPSSRRSQVPKPALRGWCGPSATTGTGAGPLSSLAPTGASASIRVSSRKSYRLSPGRPASISRPG